MVRYGYTKGRFSRYRARTTTRRTGGKIIGFRRRPRRMSRRSRGPRKQGWSRTIRSVARYAGTAGKALGLASKVYALINPEFKYVDNNTINASLPGTTTITNFITSVGQGSGSSERNGNSILLKYIKCVFNFKYGISSQPVAIRVTIVTTTTGDAPVAADVYESTGSGAATVLSPWRKNSPIEYKVWFDKIFHLDQYNPQRVHRYDIKAKGHHHIKYTGSAPTSTGPGNFWALLTNDVVGPTYSQLYRISYLDN